VIDSISKVLDELEIQSTLEKSRKTNVPPEDRMLAITKETGELLLKGEMLPEEFTRPEIAKILIEGTKQKVTP